MRKLYNEFFRIPKNGKICDRIIVTRITMLVLVVSLCLAAMSFSAYSYFSHNISSVSNIIKSANFVTNVAVEITTQNEKNSENSEVSLITGDNKNFVIRNLEPGKWYNLTISKSDRNTAETGFIVVSAEGCPITYHTQQLGVDINAAGKYTSVITFKLMITDPTDVILKSHWGTSSCYCDYKIDNIDDEGYITLNEEVKMLINGKDINKQDSDANQS